MPTIWDGLLMSSKPDMSGYGMNTAYKIIGRSGGALPSQAAVDTELSTAGLSASSGQQLVVIDEETWDTATEIDKFISLAQMYKASANFPTTARLAYYGVFPSGNYFGALDYPSGALWDAFVASNAITSALIPYVDAICPSQYCFYRNLADAEQVLRVTLKTVRGYTHKPIYPFLWHRFHTGGDFPPAFIAGISKASQARLDFTNVGGEPGTALATGDYCYIGRHQENAPTYSQVGGMTEIRDKRSQVSKVDADTVDLLAVDSTSYTTYTSGGGIHVYVPLDQMLKMMEVCLEQADGFVQWGGFLEVFDATDPYLKAMLSFISNTAYRVLALNGTTVLANMNCSARNVRKVVAGLGGDGWCFADFGSAVASKVAGNTITGTAHGSSLKFYPTPA